MPPVATMVKPKVRRRLTMSTRPGLSSSFTETNTLPPRGNLLPEASCDLAKAACTDASRPITSPVDFISGPRMTSVLGKRAKGKTLSLTA